MLWRVHLELEDRPGRLRGRATALGRAGCNIISPHVVGRRRAGLLLRRAGLRPAAELTDRVLRLRAELPSAAATRPG